ncbi:high mobility group protein HMGI-C isoform 9-T14 [Porphyrio hochstetteri]
MNQLANHLLKDQEEDPKEAKTRVPLKQLRRKQKPLVKSDPEAGPENGLNKWFKRSLLRHQHTAEQCMKDPHLGAAQCFFDHATSFFVPGARESTLGSWPVS